jgi:hypothetical protein
MGGERLWSLHGRGIDGLSASFARWTSATLLGLLGAAALVMVTRRLAGALPYPLDPAPLLAVGASVVIAVFAIRLGWPAHPSAGSTSWTTWLAMIGTSLAAMVFAASVCARGTHVVALLAFWTLLVLEEGWAWQRILRRPTRDAPRRIWRLWRRDRPSMPARHAARASAAVPTAQLPKSSDELPPDDVVQHLIRSRAKDGSDTLAGFARIAFAPGQRTGSIHVAFCPPFARTPELSLEQRDGPDARIKTAQLLPYGVRLDLKLAAEAEQRISVLLQFEARAEAGKAEIA